MSTEKKKQLDALYAELEAKAGSLPLTTTANDIVPGEGSSESEVFLIGEAPGAKEQELRRPFVGRSGKLLRKTLEEIGLSPDQVYIGNIVKARPPENRDPSPAEIKAFKPYLDKEIEILQPLLIVTLGRFSMAKFLPEVKISQVHGRPHKVTWQERTLYVLPMYHPAAALRATKIKDSFVNDMKKIKPFIKWINEQKQASQTIEDIKDVLF